MIEGIVAVPAGLLAGLVSVIGFGFDSAIEVIAVVLVAFRLSALLRHGVADERKNDSCCPWSRFPNRLLSPSRCACRGCVIALPAAEVGRGDTGDDRGAQHHVPDCREPPAKLRAALKGRLGRRPRCGRLTLVGECNALAGDSARLPSRREPPRPRPPPRRTVRRLRLNRPASSVPTGGKNDTDAS